VLAATALFGSFRTQIELALTAKAAGTFALDVAKPNVLVGVIIGASIVFLFASPLIMAAGRAAQRVMLEARNQFRTHPGIMAYEEEPDYSRVVDIVTKDSLRELITPGLLAFMARIAVGFALGYQPLGSYLAGAIAAGVLMAIFLANSGGAWDNAKKLVEDGNHVAARAPRRTPPPSSATPWATRSRTPPTCPQADRGITAIPSGVEVTRTGFADRAQYA
jgi:K(+)-stimulated pyrophosphate-energized sodium pump